MQEDRALFQIEVMPTVEGFWCKMAMYLLYLGITFTPFLVGMFFWWYLHSAWVGFMFFLFLVLVSGIVVSKLRVSSIPFAQREMNYSLKAIARWYVGKHICIK